VSEGARFSKSDPALRKLQDSVAITAIVAGVRPADASAAEAREAVVRAARTAAEGAWVDAERQDRAVGAALGRAAALLAQARAAEQARGRLVAALDR
jgi:hypothetical protein